MRTGVALCNFSSEELQTLLITSRVVVSRSKQILLFLLFYKKSTTAKKSTTTKKTTTKKAGKIYLEMSGRQIDFKTIETKANKLGGDCYVVVNEKKIYNKDGKSVNLY